MQSPQTGKSYTRIGVGLRGISRFEDDVIPTASKKLSDALPEFDVGTLPSRAGAEYVFSMEIDPRPHTAPQEQWIILLSGRIEIEVTSGECRSFGPGDLVLVMDTSGRGHRTRSVYEPVEFLILPKGQDPGKVAR